MDKQLAAIKTTRSKLVSTSRGLATLFLIIFVLYCAAHVAVFLYMALLPNGFSYLGPSTLAGTLPFIIPSISGGFTIFLLWRIFREIGRNASPFTPLRVRQIRALGFLFLATAICGFFITPGTDVGAINGGAHMLIESDASASDSIHVDATSFMISIVRFALSFIFSYGATLEQETDDLV